jgi:S-phase kinase-associated protein 1
MASSAETTETSKPSTETTAETTTKSTKIITLKISDEAIFEVEDSVAMEILVIVKSFLEDQSPSTEIVPLSNILAKPFSQFIEFCKEHVMFKENPDKEKQKKISEFFLKEKSNEELLDMITVAKYLEAEDLLDLLSQAVADRIQIKSVEYMRKFFGIENDFTPEEEAKLCEERSWAFEDVDEGY